MASFDRDSDRDIDRDVELDAWNPVDSRIERSFHAGDEPWEAWALPTSPSVDQPSPFEKPEGTARPEPPRKPLDATATFQGKPPEPDRRDGEIRFPRNGESVGGFRLITELGRGAFARVYLAEELALANRRVALKVSKAVGDEPKILARLQHTHIMPIFSLHDDPKTGLRLLCMPYFGGANLAQILDAAETRLAPLTKDRGFVEALDIVTGPSIVDGARASRGTAAKPNSVGNASTVVANRRIQASGHSPRSQFRPTSASFAIPSPARSLFNRLAAWNRDEGITAARNLTDAEIDLDPARPNRNYLRRAGYLNASVWIAARLLDGLQHAHSRGLLHRDLKPSNILVTEDGTPMLLDFNLAAETLDTSEGEGQKAQLGGTLPYMAPEHLDAFNPQGQTMPEEVDERSDVYAIGLVLFEMIAGKHPFPEPPPTSGLTETIDLMTKQRSAPPPSLREKVPSVCWSLDAILKKALAPAPRDRYQTAQEFSEDLQCYLGDLPNKYAPEPSLRERIKKWSRRHPRATSASTIALSTCLLIFVFSGIVFAQQSHLNRVRARLEYRRFTEKFRESQFQLLTIGDASDHTNEGVRLALSEIDKDVRVNRAGAWTPSPWVMNLSEEEQAVVRSGVSELALLLVRARVREAQHGESEDRRREILTWGVDWLEKAERFDWQPSRALFDDRARYQAALGNAGRAAGDRRRAEATPASTARDYYLLGTRLISESEGDGDDRAKQLAEAERLLTRAWLLDPSRYWTMFMLGVCRFDQGRFDAAAGDFATCIALKPDFAWPYVNRGLALSKSGRLDEALTTYDRALEIRPKFVEALVNRGLTYLQKGNAAAADADLSAAVELGARSHRVRIALAEAAARNGRTADAEALCDKLAAERPDDPILLVTRGMIRIGSQPERAEADFRKAIAVAPGFGPAHRGLARILRARDLKSALEQTDLALKADARDLDALELRGLIKARLGSPEAAQDFASLLRSPTANRYYNAACGMALLFEKTGDSGFADRALAYLRRAIEEGVPRETALADADLKPLVARPEFRKLTKDGGR